MAVVALEGSGSKSELSVGGVDDGLPSIELSMDCVALSTSIVPSQKLPIRRR